MSQKHLFIEFLEHFQENQNHFRNFEFNDCNLTQYEKDMIYSSLQQFQKWETSEWKHLFQFAKELWEIDYIESVKYFIREEQAHAFILAKFMEYSDIPLIKSHWTDDVFRFLRKLSSLENSVMILLTAEIIATVYYDALWKVTRSKTLQEICKQILKDEEMHVNFQSITLHLLFQRHNYISKSFKRFTHHILMITTIFIVWEYHKKVLFNGGYPFKSFYSRVMKEFYRSEKIIIWGI